MSEKPTFTYDGVTYTELLLWKVKSATRTYFTPAFLAEQVKNSAKEEGIELVSVEQANEDEATAYGEGFYEGIAIGRQGQTETPNS